MEARKKCLLHIEQLLSEEKAVQTKILAENIGVNIRNTQKNIQKLINKGLIIINGVQTNNFNRKRKIKTIEDKRNISAPS